MNNYLRSFATGLCLLLIIDASKSVAQSQILAFKFTSADNGKQASNPSTTTNSNLENSLLTRGAGASGVYANAGSVSSMVASLPVSTNKAAAKSSNAYFEFFVKAKPGHYVSLTGLDVRLRIQSESAKIYRWCYSVDNGNTFKDLGKEDITITDLNNDGVLQPSVNLSHYSELQNVPSNINIILRIYSWGGVANNNINTSAFGIGKSTSTNANAISVKGFLSTVKVPGKILGHKKGSEQIYLGSPSIVALPNGHLLASNDFFGPNNAARVDGKSVTRIYRSQDNGESWEVLTDLIGQFMSSLFVHNGEAYILGLSGNEGNIIIRKSTDDGNSWTTPTDETNGIIKTGKYHTAPTPIIVHGGRLWKAMEDTNGAIQTWPKKFRALMISAPVNDNLLLASSWLSSNALSYDSSYLGGYFYGWLEGNAAVTPNGELVNILRVQTFDKQRERIAIVKVNNSGTTASFNAATDFKDFPGGGKKFTIRYDSLSNKYFTLSNYVPDAYKGINSLDKVRNTLALCSSSDLLSWTVDSIVLSHPDTLYHGFQYVDWQFAGNDIIAVSRTAFDDGIGGANTYHNNNYLTFHKILNFRGNNTTESLPANFQGQVSGRTVRLNWSMPNQTTTDDFEIKRINSDATTKLITERILKNNSGNQINYEIKDPNPSPGKNIYQLKLKNTSSLKENVKSVSLTIADANFKKFNIIPSTNENYINAKVYNMDKGVAELKIVNLSGNIILSKSLNINENYSDFELPFNEKGFYIATLKTTTGEAYFSKFLAK